MNLLSHEQPQAATPLPDLALKDALRVFLSQPGTCLDWFEPLFFQRTGTSEGEIVEIMLPHAFYHGWLAQHGKATLEQAIFSLCGPQTHIVYSHASLKSHAPQGVSTPAFGSVISPGHTTSLAPTASPSQLQATFSPYPIFVKPEPHPATTEFDAFLSNGKNQFVYSLLKEAAEKGVPYNPIFLKGASGTGKTHLLRAVAAGLATRLAPPLASSRVALLSANDFSSLFASSSSESVRANASRALLRSAEAFCLDDVNVLAEQPRAQEELIALLDYFIDHGKPVIVTFSISASVYQHGQHAESQHSAYSPVRSFGTQIGRLSPPLLARLSSGMTLELAEPDLDVRIRYAQTQLEENGLRPNKENAMFLARRCPNLRHLRGAVLRMAAFRTHTGQLPDETDMDTILTSTGNPHALTPEAVLTLVATHCGYSARDLRGKKRDPRLVQARQIAMFLCRELLGESYPSLGRLFGGKDHSTVMHSVKKIRENQVTNKDMHMLVTELTQRCQNYLFPT